MYSVVDDDKSITMYPNITKVVNVKDIKTNTTYIFVQEENRIIIWEANGDKPNEMPVKAIKDLCNYYKNWDLNFSEMPKKIIHL